MAVEYQITGYEVIIMYAVSYTILRSKLASMMDRVSAQHVPILVTRQRGTPCVLMSLDDYNAYEETAYLMRSIKNAERLSSAISELEERGGQTRDIIE